MSRSLIAAFALIFTLHGALAAPKQSPMIGIYTQPVSAHPNITDTYKIAASYVKYIEMSGAQVVPLFSNSTKDSLLALLKKVNGIVFTVGAMDFNISDWWTASNSSKARTTMIGFSQSWEPVWDISCWLT